MFSFCSIQMLNWEAKVDWEVPTTHSIPVWSRENDGLEWDPLQKQWFYPNPCGSNILSWKEQEREILEERIQELQVKMNWLHRRCQEDTCNMCSLRVKRKKLKRSMTF